MLYRLGNREPVIVGTGIYIADSAEVIGSVIVKQNASVWFNSVLRGDIGTIVIGEGSNMQDACVLHTDEGGELVVGKGVTVGHGAVLHGCSIGDNTLIGIRAVVLNGAAVGSNCIIGAGALLPEGTRIPDNSLVLGVPGKVARQVSMAQIEEIRAASVHYINKARVYREELIMMK